MTRFTRLLVMALLRLLLAGLPTFCLSVAVGQGQNATTAGRLSEAVARVEFFTPQTHIYQRVRSVLWLVLAG
jgi:hypothetical protein